MDCRGLFINLLASLNLLEVTQLVTGNDTFAFETSCFRMGTMRLDLQQIQGGQQILVSRKGAKAQRRCLALLLGSQEIFASFAPLREICWFRRQSRRR